MASIHPIWRDWRHKVAGIYKLAVSLKNDTTDRHENHRKFGMTIFDIYSID